MRIILFKQKGFSAIMAIVVVVLLALLGASMSTLTTISFLNTSSSTSGIQSWFAARSAVDWAVHTAVNQSCTCGTNCCASINGTNINFSAGGLTGYKASFDGTTGCSEIPLSEGGANYCVYNIDVLGSRDAAGDITYASRRIKISITDRNSP